MRNTMSEMKNILEGIDGRLDIAEEKFNDLKDSNRNYPKLKKKKNFLMNKVSMSCRIILSSLISV